MALRCANRKFTHGSVERHVALWVGRQYAVLPLAAMHLCRGKADWPCGVQTVSSRAAQWAACGPLRLPVMMPCWLLAAMRLYLEFAYAGNGPVPGGKTDWPCGMQTGSSRASQ